MPMLGGTYVPFGAELSPHAQWLNGGVSGRSREIQTGANPEDESSTSEGEGEEAVSQQVAPTPMAASSTQAAKRVPSWLTRVAPGLKQPDRALSSDQLQRPQSASDLVSNSATVAPPPPRSLSSSAISARSGGALRMGLQMEDDARPRVGEKRSNASIHAVGLIEESAEEELASMRVPPFKSSRLELLGSPLSWEAPHAVAGPQPSGRVAVDGLGSAPLQGDSPSAPVAGGTSLFEPSYEWRDVPDAATLPPGLEVQERSVEGGTRRARIPPSWELSLWVDHEWGHWSFPAVGRATTVRELRTALAEYLGLAVDAVLVMHRHSPLSDDSTAEAAQLHQRRAELRVAQAVRFEDMTSFLQRR